MEDRITRTVADLASPGESALLGGPDGSLVPAESYVLFPLGEKRFALKAEYVTELARPDLVQFFPHTTPLITGVLIRRSYIIPVCDVAPVLVGDGVPPRKYYLIAKHRCAGRWELVAIPVTGDCELTSADMKPAPSKLPYYASGVLGLDFEIVEVIDLGKLLGGEEGA
jgi:chemotaxis signal transduction protein